jgi:ElaA protein
VDATALHVAAFDELSTATLYALLRLRVDVFVVEQECAYPELDGRDDEPGARHLWIAGPDGDLRGYLRILRDDDGTTHIGRVTVARPHRGAGLAAQLMDAALAHIGDAPCELEAQVQVADFYSRWGFTVTGPEFDLDGIPHVPMHRPTPE